MTVSDLALADIETHLEEIDAEIPDLDLDIAAEASVPDGSRPLLNGPGLAPGCVLDNVYVLPGIPGEMRAMFRDVEGDFSGSLQSQFLYTVEPEANIIDALDAVRDRFGVRVGCYPDREARHNRLKLTGEDEDAIEAAKSWLLAEIDASEDPVEREW
jgi:molybdopterin-biosynthesis enzyme MoeA-like protein